MFLRQEMSAAYDGAVGAAFAALCRTLAFRRWQSAAAVDGGHIPQRDLSYCYRTGSVQRAGRVVEVMRPVGLTLKEILHDPPCRVSLTMRWRIEPAAPGCAVRLVASYRLNHAANLRARHWNERLRRNFRKQFTFLGVNLGRMHDQPASATAGVPERDASHS